MNSVCKVLVPVLTIPDTSIVNNPPHIPTYLVIIYWHSSVT